MTQGEHISTVIDNSEQNEKRLQLIQTCYEKYVTTGDEFAFTDLIDLLDAFFQKKIVRDKLYITGCLDDDNLNTALQDARFAVFNHIKKLCEKGDEKRTIDPGFIWYCRRIYRNKTYDVIRKVINYNRRVRDIGEPVYLDDLMPDGTKTIGESTEDKNANMDNVFKESEKRRVFGQINYLYCKTLVETKDKPSRQLALYYARILPHILHIIFDIETISDTVAASAKWAYKCMQGETIKELSLSSEEDLINYISPKLSWSEFFWECLYQPVSKSEPLLLLKDIIYTDRYQSKRIEDWSETMHKKIVKELRKVIEQNKDLKEAALEYSMKKDKWSCILRGGREK